MGIEGVKIDATEYGNIYCIVGKLGCRTMRITRTTPRLRFSAGSVAMRRS